MKRGFLISFEGGEACGKSTQIKLFEKYLKEKNENYLLTREPGGTEIGEKIREILLHSKGEISSEGEFLLFSSSRRNLVEKVILPALEEGKIVVLDRFFDSSFAYQGYAGNLNIKDIKNITDFATGGLKPDLTILFDISYEESMRRKAKDENLKVLDRMESKGSVYHKKVREGYLTLAKQNPDRFVVIDATKSIDEIAKTVIDIFEKRRRAK